jgi:hypothetical protein
MWEYYFEVIMQDYVQSYDKLLAISGSDGLARSALMMFCFVSRYDWESARSFFTKSTFYRNKRLLDNSGLSGQLPQYKKHKYDV